MNERDVYDVEAKTQVALAEAIGERVNRRLLAVYILVTLVGFISLLYLQREFAEFRRDVVAVCIKTNEANGQVNAVLERLAANARTAPGRTPEERKAISERYAAFHLPISDCPPGR